MDSDQVIETFTDYYLQRGHRRVTGTSLLPPDPGDPVLFTTSGMHPLTPYLDGSRRHPLGRRLVNVQRCLRTTDLDEVGDRSHLTVFRMLGTWSLGDYSHEQSIRWGYDLLTEGFGIRPDRMHVTVFGGDSRVGPDTDSLDVWNRLGVDVEVLGGDNWWSNGTAGPCGPDSEIFVWTGGTPPEGSPSTDPRWVEVWNHVHLRFRSDDRGTLRPLSPPNVDTGMGLERMLTVLQGTDSVHGTELFEPWRRTLTGLWRPDEPDLRLLSDHLRSSIAVAGDGVRPSNSGRGYVLRRLIRRSLTVLWRLDPSGTLSDLPVGLFERTLDEFSQRSEVGPIRQVLLDEEVRFRRLVERGRDRVDRMRRHGPLTERDLEFLRDTHGLPRDLVESLLVEPTGAGHRPGRTLDD